MEDIQMESILNGIKSKGDKNFIGIEAGTSQWDVLAGFGFRRLGLTIIRNILLEDKWNVVNHYEKIGKPSPVLDDPLLRSDNTVVGISSITTTIPRAYELAKKIKKINPNIPVVMGGFHPTACPDEALDYADFVIRGEGEESVKELLCSSQPIEKIQGISYWKEGQKKHNSDRQLLNSLSYSLPLIEPDLCNEPVTPLLFGRGCPYKCKFCAVSQVMGPKMRMRSPHEVIKELQLLVQHGAKRVFFVDDNFFGNMEQTKELLHLMVKEKVKLPIIIQMRADIRVSRDPETLNLMKKAGIFLLCVGIEFIDDTSLKEISKGLTMEQVIEFVATMQQWKFSFYTMFIFGSPRDNEETPHNIIAFMKEHLPYELLQIMHFNPFPGTTFYQEVKEHIFDHDWTNYTMNRVVWQHPNMQPLQQYETLLKAYKMWYNPLHIAQILGQKLLTGQWETVTLTPYFLKGIYNTMKEWEHILTVTKV